MKSFKEGCAANDEFQTANSSLQSGELVRDLMEHRLRVPSVPDDTLARPNLDRMICQALQAGRLLQLEAPGGYGKTHALVSALASAPDVNVRWISLNAGGDNAPSRFLSILAMALGLAEVLPPNGGTFEDHLTMLLVNRDRQAREVREVLVLDNVHHLTNPAVSGLLHQLVTHLPSGLSVAMASRLPVPFESHTLELNGNYTRLGPDILEFSRSETFEFFAKARSDSLITSVAIDHLFGLTEGWPTPLALYRRELKQGGGERRALHETPPSVERFLKDCIAAQLGGSAQLKSMRAIAELDSCSDELFFAIEPSVSESGGMPPSEAADRGLPLKPVPGRGGRWYRLNPLLQAWLQSPR